MSKIIMVLITNTKSELMDQAGFHLEIADFFLRKMEFQTISIPIIPISNRFCQGCSNHAFQFPNLGQVDTYKSSYSWYSQCRPLKIPWAV